MGIPTEEDLYDKVKLIRRGVSNNIDVTVMIHPCSHDCLGTSRLLKITCYGKAVQAAAFPWKGIYKCFGYSSVGI